jgi:hypothetical protein
MAAVCEERARIAGDLRFKEQSKIAKQWWEIARQIELLEILMQLAAEKSLN